MCTPLTVVSPCMTFFVLEDDRHFFPPYAATALVRGETLTQHPEIAPILSLLTQAFNSQKMRELNLRIQEQGETVSRVATDALQDLHLIETQDQASSATPPKSTSFWKYVWNNRSTLMVRTGEHLLLSGMGLSLGILLAIPLALLLERWRQGLNRLSDSAG